MANQTKAEQLAEQVALAVNAGAELHLPSVDFNDPNRPKTCLEVDFPILPINQIAQIEGNAGKPIYQMSKWWARRRSSVFRATLIAAATKAPDDPAEAAKTVWDAYYGNHQQNEAFQKLKVADIFMGGGTTLVEGARLGMQMVGNDLNPVAWLVVKNELADVDLAEVQALFDHIEREVKPQIMPFYACEGPNGEKGIWTNIATNEVMGEDFEPLALTPQQRKDYSYHGPEVIYTFWAKHGPCAAPGCGHRTPLMSSPVVAVKSLSVKAWLGVKCSQEACGKAFDLEQQETRMAPDVPLVVADSEKPFAVMDSEGHYVCPHCQHHYHDLQAAMKGESIQLPKKLRKNKKIDMTLLVHSDWLQGAAGHDALGVLGGSATSECDATMRWNLLRAKTLRLVEVRGDLPAEITCPETSVTFSTSAGTIPKNAHFTCQGTTCGQMQSTLAAIGSSGRTGAMAAYTLQCYSPERNEQGVPYNGRYFKAVTEVDVKRQNTALREWEARKETDLKGYWPKSEIPFGHMTHQRQPLPQHGFTHWHTMFNSRQLLVHALILKAIDSAVEFKDSSKEIVLGAFQQFLAYENLFCFWHKSHDHFAPHLSNNNYHSKNTSIEVGVFSPVGYGPWRSAKLPIFDALEWKNNPWELVSNDFLKTTNADLTGLTGMSEKTEPNDPVLSGSLISCGSSTDLNQYPAESFDLVITDPPFSGLLYYAELADFFYVWLRLVLKDKYPDYFTSEYSPKTLEAVANPASHPDDADTFYKRVLTECWREAYRLLKPAGILSFTFHHSEDEPWVDVLESLFEAGFYLEVTYPIRSDETKGEGEFGSKTIEYDIIHVCRKRTEQPSRISWARLRRQILSDVRQLQSILEHHQNEGLPKADIQVIKRGKALEYFSRHYGQVYVEEGREFTVKEALVGINQILDDQDEGEAGGTPVICEPITRQFLRIFSNTTEVPRDQMQKFLRGTGIGPSDFVGRGWCEEKKKIFYWSSPLLFAKERKEKFKNLKQDFDQALVLIGACYPDSGIAVKQLLSEDFKPHPALANLLNWLIHHSGSSQLSTAATTAQQLYNNWASQHPSVLKKQLSLFDLESEA